MTEEKALHCTKAAVYEFHKESKTWEPVSQGNLVEIYILVSNKGRYRVVGNLGDGGGWCLNGPIYSTLVLQKVSPYFVQWQDHLKIHGLAFSQDAHATSFAKVITICSKNILEVANNATPTNSNSFSSLNPAYTKGRSVTSLPKPLSSFSNSTSTLPSISSSSSSSNSSAAPSSMGTFGRSAAAKLAAAAAPRSEDGKDKKKKSPFGSWRQSVVGLVPITSDSPKPPSSATSSSSSPIPPGSQSTPPSSEEEGASNTPSSSYSSSSTTSRSENSMESILNSKPPPPTCDRDRPAYEIYTSEISYVKTLVSLADVIVPSFRNLEIQDKFDLEKNIFSNVAQIRALNTQFLTSLHVRVQSWDPEATVIGDAFDILLSFSKAYVQYIKNYESVPAIIDGLKKQKVFDKWLKHPEIEKETGGQGLLNLLIQPCQRFIRYNMLIGEVLKRTPETHPDYNELKKVLEEIGKLTMMINTTVATKQMEEKVEKIRKGTEYIGFEELLSKSGRLLLDSFPVTVPMGGASYTWFLLWNDVIAFASNVTEKKVTKKKFETSLILEHCWFNDGSNDTSLELVTPSDFYIITYISKSERDKCKQVCIDAIQKRQSDVELLSEDTQKRKFQFQFPEGLYAGEWFGGKIEGEGVFDYKSGSSYHGQFLRGKRHGQGRMNYESKAYYEGDWESDLPHGNGVLDLPNTGVYTGNWEKGRKHGQGKMTWINGDVYEGGWVNDTMTGKGLLTLANGFVYEGELLQNAFHGEGKLISFGNTYVGQFVNDRKHGNGVMTYASEAVYEGEWKNDERHGKGTFTSKGGKLKYEGDWEDDMMHGKGRLVAENNYEYVGSFNKNAKQGQGTWTHIDGSKYEGSWLDDKKEGEGEYTSAFGSVYNGNWHADRRIGKGNEKYADGSHYIGDFYRDLKHGKGKIIYPDGSMYSGDWVEDRRHGRGTFRFPNGSSYIGDWENDQRSGTGQFTDRTGEYDGQWKADFREGTGQFKSDIDKSIFQITWKNDNPDGRGSLLRPDGTNLEVSFSEGKLDRPTLADLPPSLPLSRAFFR